MKPTISVVIALAPGRKADVLNSLEKLNYPKEKYEIIIEEGKNPSQNRNNGVKKSKAEIIAFIDDDAYMHPEILLRAEQFFNKHKTIDIVGGPQLTPKTDKTFAKLSGIIISSYFGAATMSKRYKKSKFTLKADENMLTSANCFVRKKAFITIGGFNPKLFPGEDPEFFARAARKGNRIAYDPELIVYHKRRASYKEFLKQFFNYGRTRPKKESQEKGKTTLLYFIPLFFGVYIIPLLILGFLHWIFFIPLILYALLAIGFSIYESIKNKNILLIILGPILYLSMHTSYGIGMLLGYLKPVKNRGM